MLEVNSLVEPFEAKLDDNTIVTIPEKGKKYILFFYPKDSTPGCTAEACSIRDGYVELKKMGYEVYGISVDSVASHQKFKEKQSLNFPLISDEEKKIVNQFGVWGQKKFMGREYLGTHRTTFVIDQNGIISHRIDKIDTKEAANQLIEILKN